MTSQEPRTAKEIQQWLVDQLADLIYVDPEEIDVNETFDGYGLASREAVMLSGDLEEWLGRRLSPTVVYEYPTIEALAQFLAAGEPEPPQPDVVEVSPVAPPEPEMTHEPIAIVGIGCRFPGADGPDAFWRLLRDGVDTITKVPPDRWDADAFYDPQPGAPGKMYTRWGGFLDRVDQFDPHFFGISPREAVHMDPQQRLLLEVAWQALEDAGYDPHGLAQSRTGVFVGISNNDYSLFQSDDLTSIEAYTGTGNASCVAANRLSYLLDLRGPSFAVDTACSSSLVAVHLACQSLRRGESGLALAGGVNLILSPRLHIAFSQARMMSPTGRCKTFDADADGYVRGEGCGMVVLKRLSDALRDGDHVWAVIQGSAINHDGRSNGLTAPNGLSQQAVIRQAQRDAGVTPDQIGYVEAHGTGTKLGDPIEIESLAKAFKDRSPEDLCVLGSVKTNIGHLESAAGVAGLIKVVLALKHEAIPPHLHFKTINPYISIDQMPFEIPTEPRPWRSGNGPRHAGVSSFGFGGTNAHVVLAEPPARDAPHNEVERPWHVLCLSGRDDQALRELAGRYASYLGNDIAAPLADVCFTANTGRTHFAHRLAVAAASSEQMRQRLEAFVAGEGVAGMSAGRSQSSDRPQVAFLFTGQGAQYPGMGRQLYETQPTFRAALDRCAEILDGHLPRPLLSVIFPEADEETPIHDTTYTQPALFALEYALAELWRAWGIEPDYVLGHSVGEYVAACVAGVFSLEDGLKLIAARGRLMGALPQDGEMAVVFAAREQVAAALASYEERVSIAGVNGPSNTVISGERGAVGEVVAQLEAEGVTVRPLTVSHAFHSPLMEPILDEFEQIAREVQFRSPKIPLLSNVTGHFLAPLEPPDAGYWRRHIRQGVQFQAGMQALAEAGCTVFVEIGPHPSLLSMGRRCLPDHEGLWLPALRRGRDDWSVLSQSLGELYVAGLPVDWAGFDGDYARQRVPLPTYPFQRQRYWTQFAGREQAPFRPVAAVESGHPLLGGRLRSPVIRDVLFESRLSAQLSPWLADHRIYGVALFPAAAFLELVWAAATEAFGPGAHAVQDVALLEAIAVPQEDARAVQVVLTPPDDGFSSFQVFSLTEGEGESEPAWTLHATGNVRLATVQDSDVASDRFSPEAVQARCEEGPGSQVYYQKLSARGFQYGPSFQGIEKLWRRDGEAVGRVQLPGVLASDEGAFHVHPALLDAGFQLLAATLSDDEQQAAGSGLYLPVGLERFRLLGRVGDRAWGHARLRQDEASPAGVLVGDVQLYGDDGQLLAAVVGLQVRRVSREAVLGVAPERLEEWLYQITWQPRAATVSDDTRIEDPGAWLILADRGGVGAVLAELLDGLGESYVLVHAGETFGRTEDGMWCINPGRREDFDRLLVEALGDGGSCYGVLHLWSLDERVPSNATPAEIEAAQTLGSAAALHLVQALVTAGWTRTPRLWLVTRGSQSVGGETAPLAVAQAPLWGLGHVVALEHPELRPVRVDLDPVSDSIAELLLEEIWSGDGEDRVAFRDGARYVPRLVRRTAAVAVDGGAGQRPVRLEIPQRGTLDNLALLPLLPRRPGPGEIQIQIYATGLNFRDVLNALDLYPGDPGPLGGECAGRVVAVGEGVTELAVGDGVIAIAPGSFASLTTTYADLAIHKPANLSFEEAATIPIAFLTAHYALHHLAGMAAGDKVFIHSASGGVGQAALQLARRVGAEVFGTAGSPDKREFLRSLGIRHVMDSRALTFAEQVMDVTDEQGVDMVLNALPGKYITQGLSMLAPGGRFLELGKLEVWTDERVAALREDVSYFAIALDDLSRDDPALIQSMFRELVPLFEAGELEPLPLKTYPLDDVVSAFRFMQQAKHIGKIVITQRPPATGTSSLRADATYLITGGLGALGLRVARWMVEQGARHLVLVGRSGPSEAAAVALDELEALGAQVVVAQADVSRQDQVAQLLADLRADATLPPLRGVVHAAGVLDDGVLLQQDWDRFEKVMAPKVAGAWNLHALTRDAPLDWMIFFSSIASLLGSPGQGNYAAANAFMDALAQHRRAQGLPALSVNWGPWADAGMAAAAGDAHRRRRALGGMDLLPPDRGVQALAHVLGQDGGQVAVMRVDWPALVQTFGLGGEPPLLSDLVKRAGGDGALPLPTKSELVERLEKAPPGQRQQVLVDYLRARIIKILGLDPDFPLDTGRPLNEMGFDSLMAVELKSVLNNAVGRNLPATLAFEYPTVEALAGYLTTDVLGMETTTKSNAQEPSTDDELTSDSVLTELEQISEDEAEALLLEKLAALEGDD